MDRTIEILQHHISYWYYDDQVGEMPESEQEHVQQMIIEGYREGELNYYNPETDEEIRGWWKIIK